MSYRRDFYNAEATSVLQKRLWYCGLLYYRRGPMYYKRDVCTVAATSALQKRTLYYRGDFYTIETSLCITYETFVR